MRRGAFRAIPFPRRYSAASDSIRADDAFSPSAVAELAAAELRLVLDGRLEQRVLGDVAVVAHIVARLLSAPGVFLFVVCHVVLRTVAAANETRAGTLTS